ncbi:NAD(P)-binding protein [Lentithecium fluviatile CBS 122367]|uniref:NAD(P)-binding protein n=1 Tax=Lentithecium fluviatile CBS 122367 TaxID=1168545 RepID=A0A6G1JH04_9PLEO|nr:NAD(P)-binding protein [Lentithecium fluviatile CBS 122367]
MSSIVAVAGGTGKLGRAIIDSLVSSGMFEVLVFAREASESKSKEFGAKVLAIDYSSVDSIVSVLEQNKIDTLISTLGSTSGVDPEMALIKAADKATATKRYIPSTWGIKYTPEVAEIFPIAVGKIAVLQALEMTSLEYTCVTNGFFLDYWVVPHVKSYLGGVTLAIDMANKTAAIPGSGNVPVVFTYSFDIGNLVASLLTLPEGKWDKESYIIGDKVTMNEFLAIAEEARGGKFDTKYDSMEMLKEGRITELPGQKEVYPFFPKEMMQGFLAAFGVMFEQGVFDFKPERSLNQRFPEVRMRGVRELVMEAWKGK